MTCVHCDRPIRAKDQTYTYKQARVKAHLRCVAQPSTEETDLLLLAFQRSR